MKELPIKGHSNSQGGFTLIEILVAIAVITLLAAFILPSIDQYITFSQKLETQADAEKLRKAMTQAYLNNAMTIDTQTGPTIWMNTAGTETFTTDSTVPLDDPAGTETGYQALSNYTGKAPNKTAVDGFNRPWQVYVSDLLYGHYLSYTIPYHVIAFVSVSSNGASQNDSASGVKFDAQTGQLTLPPHASAAIINGLPIEEKLYSKTIKKLHTIANAYGTYFTTTYLASTQRNLGMDYFATSDSNDTTNTGEWDSTSEIGNSGNGNGPGFPYPGVTNSPLTNTNVSVCDVQPADSLSGFASALGLSGESMTSAWGYPIGIGNGPNSNSAASSCYGDDRDPSSANGNLQTPPFTAFVDAWAPGGTLIAVPVIGAY
ncbi:prepilin-type N-terminal cleavage/methylation domain-containing protein [Acidithiobacillus sp.]|uniref:prepilin-type N-terminal cleavage/methylation domain-containing protein n=1 Tax=Acidithiobacillus sp. TaxID=1872118 RepID=UPI00260DE182|nr:prepilin-type N-terminal cleavage/methylation domain-containing protein [Acidithiobacillus sp.]MDD5278651.1 prepilin-type N-terminal cleavage/methylation domain-containing protein [Acidithiobacillus sp.]